MPDQFCPNCGTEVEADARFCPTCGTTLATEPVTPEADEAALEIPAALAWSDPGSDAPEVAAAPQAAARAPETTAGPPSPPAAPPPAAESPTPGPQPSPPGIDLPITWPAMLSGWLIGAGSLMGALVLIPRLGNVVSLLLFLALIGIAATIFLADRVPEVPRLRLIVLVTTMIGLGVALARAGFSVQGLDTLFLVAMLAAAGGTLLIELDRDRPMPPPERTGG